IAFGLLLLFGLVLVGHLLPIRFFDAIPQADAPLLDAFSITDPIDFALDRGGQRLAGFVNVTLRAATRARNDDIHIPVGGYCLRRISALLCGIKRSGPVSVGIDLGVQFISVSVVKPGRLLLGFTGSYAGCGIGFGLGGAAQLFAGGHRFRLSLLIIFIFTYLIGYTSKLFAFCQLYGQVYLSGMLS